MSTRLAVLFAAGGLTVLLSVIYFYGSYKHDAGYQLAQTEIREENAKRLKQMQADLDDANLLAQEEQDARETVEDELSTTIFNHGRTIARLNGLLETASKQPGSSHANGPGNAAGADWIGLFGECVATVEENSNALRNVARDAAEWADQVTVLQRYVYTVQPGAPRPKSTFSRPLEPGPGPRVEH